MYNCRMLQGEHSAILLTIIKLPVVFKTVITLLFMVTQKHNVLVLVFLVRTNGTCQDQNLVFRFRHKTASSTASLFNPFQPDGISHYYQLEQSISILRVLQWYFTFLLKFQLNIL